MNGFTMSSIARVVPNQISAFQHLFGGSPTHRGIVPHGNIQPLHLLYTFDTDDPLFPIHIPGIRYLPLYYCFPYNAGAMSYRVVSDDEIQILFMETNHVEHDFPYENYPNEFPAVPVSLVPISNEENGILTRSVLTDDWFDIESLPKSDRQFLRQSCYPFTQIGGEQRMWQGVPDAYTYNQRWHHKELMDVFAVIWNNPVPNVHLWDDEPNDDTQIIFQFCPKCHSIYVCNRCT